MSGNDRKGKADATAAQLRLIADIKRALEEADLGWWLFGDTETQECRSGLSGLY